MGTIISKAAGSIGTLLGNSFVAPFKAIFGKSCEGVCQGTWELICFIENLCISNLLRLLMVLVLTYITLLFVYLLFKVGIIQCIGRNLCKISWAACTTYWTALEEMSCFLWHKIKNTKRTYRRRKFKDLEEGYSSSYEDGDGYSSDDYESVRVMRRRRLMREKRRDEMKRSLYPIRDSLKGRRRCSRSGSGHHVRLKTREVSVHVKHSGSLRHSRQNNALKLIKRRRIK
ncbi:hypothetical protein J5N97_000112 [Dioscorea zingiberensis]|uniref:Uncharacterized protein n=1 Tax=Dioscorea zingiberensis TaxID=325984 RepID=A0A9D5H1X1_9LILI|nr:hypothetical protein J5N97_000112 [Dioscorea zingiberensis]